MKQIHDLLLFFDSPVFLYESPYDLEMNIWLMHFHIEIAFHGPFRCESGC